MPLLAPHIPSSSKAIRSKAVSDIISARKNLDAPTQSARYIVNVDSHAQMSPRTVVGVPPMGYAMSVSSKHPLERHETKTCQYKDRVAGGCGLPLESTKEARDIVYYLEQFAIGDVDTANHCVANNTVAFDAVDAHGNNGLHYAARAGNLEGAKLAQILKIGLNSTNNGGMTPLHYAVTMSASMGPGGRLSPVLQWLILQGADQEAKTTSGLTPEQLAASIGATSVAEWLKMCKTVPRWQPSKETIANGGPGDAIHKAPFSTGSKTVYVPTRSWELIK